MIRPESRIWRSGILLVLVAGGLGTGLAVRGAAGDGPARAAAPVKAPPAGCGQRVTSQPLPARFPAMLPLPAGIAITKVASSQENGLPPVVTIQGLAPLSLSAAGLFFLRRLPAKGFDILKSEAEPGLEAEGRFLGHGTSGAYRVRNAPCGRGVALLVGVVLAA